MQPFRRLDWKYGTSGTTDIQRGRESLSKDILAEVNGVAELPETLRIRVAVYDVAGEREPLEVVCFVEPDPRNQTLTLVPCPGEVQRAVDVAQASIRERINAAVGDKIRVYYGTP